MKEHIRGFLHDPVENESVTRAFLFWVGFSFLALSLGPFTNYSAAGFLDPWIYTGYFTNFSVLVHQFGLLYYPSRLPYVLFGVLMYSLFAPTVANFLINLSILTACSLSLYCIIARHTNRATAGSTAIIFCLNPCLMAAVSWDYPDGPAIAFLLLGLWIALAPPQKLQGRLGLVLVGSLWAMAGFTNLIIGLVILPGLILLAYFIHFNAIQIVKKGLLMAIGVLATAALFALFSKGIFNDYRFYEQQFKVFLYVTTTQGFLATMWGTGLAWLGTAYRLGMTYGLTLIGGFALIRYFRQLKADRFYLGSYLFLFLSNVTFFVGEFVMKDTVLRVAYQNSYLVVPAFVFFGALLGSLRRIAQTTSLFAIGMSSSLALLCAIAPVYLFSRPNHLVMALHNEYWTVALDVGIAGLLASCLFGRAKSIGLTVAALCFSFLVGFTTTVDPGLSYAFVDSRPAYQAAMRTQNVLTSGIAEGRKLRFWFDPDERWSSLFHSINSLYLWGWRDYSHAITTMPADDLRNLFSANTTVVHLTQDPTKVAERTQLMSERNILVEEIGRWKIKEGNIEFQIILQNVRDASSPK